LKVLDFQLSLEQSKQRSFRKPDLIGKAGSKKRSCSISFIREGSGWPQSEIRCL